MTWYELGLRMLKASLMVAGVTLSIQGYVGQPPTPWKAGLGGGVLFMGAYL